MPNYFLDTSALAKRYHNETGSVRLDRLMEEARSSWLISHLSIVEFESVLAKKTRAGDINEEARQIARRRFRTDLVRHRLLIAPPVEEHHFRGAKNLLMEFGVSEGLRTLDSLQLAMALDLRRIGLVDVFVAADQRLCRVASLAGCLVVNPEQPGPEFA